MKSALKKNLFNTPIINRVVKYYHFTSIVQSKLEGCDSVLELGCGYFSYITNMKNKPHSVGVDLFSPVIEHGKKNKIHDEYVLLNVMNIDQNFKDQSFDCVMAMDLIEHLTKEDGMIFLKKMERIARKRVILYTPNGFLKQDPCDGNPYQEHKSGWSAEEMRSYGYSVIGYGGLKSLRPQFEITKKPIWFWTIVSRISYLYTRNRPELAFQILCIKDIK